MPNSCQRSDSLAIMLEEYNSLQEEVRLADNLYMQAFTFGFTGISAVIGFFISSNKILIQFAGTIFVVPLICTILSYYMFLHQEHVRHTILTLYISQYRLDSLVNNKGTLFSRSIMRGSNLSKPISSRSLMSVVPIIVMIANQLLILLLHIYDIYECVTRNLSVTTIKGVSREQYVFFCLLELLIPFMFFVVWCLSTRKMRYNIKEMKRTGEIYFSKLANIRARI